MAACPDSGSQHGASTTGARPPDTASAKCCSRDALGECLLLKESGIMSDISSCKTQRASFHFYIAALWSEVEMLREQTDLHHELNTLTFQEQLQR